MQQPNQPRPIMEFKCPSCSTPGKVPMPEGEIVTNEALSIVVFKNREYTCPGCLGKFTTQLAMLPDQGQVWAVVPERVREGSIAPPPPGFNPKPQKQN